MNILKKIFSKKDKTYTKEDITSEIIKYLFNLPEIDRYKKTIQLRLVNEKPSKSCTVDSIEKFQERKNTIEGIISYELLIRWISENTSKTNMIQTKIDLINDKINIKYENNENLDFIISKVNEIKSLVQNMGKTPSIEEKIKEEPKTELISLGILGDYNIYNIDYESKNKISKEEQYNKIKEIIKGFQKLPLLDSPGKVACTVFTGGCNFRCPFCHNALLVREMDDIEYTEKEIFEHLERRKGVIEGVAVTGGEPLLQKDIERFLYELKCAGVSVKLDTNGSFPEKLKGILELGIVDYVAMDIKNSKEKYAQTVGVQDFDISTVEQSIQLLQQSGVDYEFRTTVTANFHTIEDMRSIARWLQGTPKYFLQNFVDSGMLIDSTCKGVSKAEMQEMLSAVREFIPAAELRGI